MDPKSKNIILKGKCRGMDAVVPATGSHAVGTVLPEGWATRLPGLNSLSDRQYCGIIMTNA